MIIEKLDVECWIPFSPKLLENAWIYPWYILDLSRIYPGLSGNCMGTILDLFSNPTPNLISKFQNTCIEYYYCTSMHILMDVYVRTYPESNIGLGIPIYGDIDT